MKLISTAIGLAFLSVAPSVAMACEYNDATSASATLPEQWAAAPAATKVPAAPVAKAMAPAATKPTAAKVKAPALDQKVASTSPR